MPMKAQRPPVAAEGVPFIAFAGFATVVVAALGHALPAWLGMAATAFCLWFFRDPERHLPAGEGVVVAPADGRVIAVARVGPGEYCQEPAYKVSIFMNVFDVHVNRSPVAGRVTGCCHRPGRFYSADTERGELENERNVVTIETADGRRVTVIQVAGLIARRIVCWAEPGDRLAAGERFGLIRFGSRVDCYLPLETELAVAVGQKVRAGETLLGRLPGTTCSQSDADQREACAHAGGDL